MNVNAIDLPAFLRLERLHRRDRKWWSGRYRVRNSHGVVVFVEIESYNMYNQFLRLNRNPVNHCSGHTIDSVSGMQDHLRNTINSVTEPLPEELSTICVSELPRPKSKRH